MSDTLIERMRADLEARAERAASLRHQLSEAEASYTRLENALAVILEFDGKTDPGDASAGKGIQQTIYNLLLGASPKGMRHADILDRLCERGFSIDSKQLSNALFHLATKGQVEKIGRGHWRYAPTQTAPNLRELVAEAAQ